MVVKAVSLECKREQMLCPETKETECKTTMCSHRDHSRQVMNLAKGSLHQEAFGKLNSGKK